MVKLNIFAHVDIIWKHHAMSSLNEFLSLHNFALKLKMKKLFFCKNAEL